MRVYATDGEKFYRLDVSVAWADKHDNGAIISCGLRVGEDFSVSQLHSLMTHGKAREVSESEYDHSGCQSSCVMRGDKKCRW